MRASIDIQQATSAPDLDRRTRKRLATRQLISDVATRLFVERGFDRVTVEEIADAADVGRMTVFNHFARKEDMFFDQDQAARELLLTAVREREPDVSPIEALRRLTHHLVTTDSRHIRFFAESQNFVEAVAASDTLKARARAIRDEVVESMTIALADSVGRSRSDVDAHLAASLLVTSWTVAFIEAHRLFRRDADPSAAKALFLSVVDKGCLGLTAALATTPYVCPP